MILKLLNHGVVPKLPDFSVSQPFALYDSTVMEIQSICEVGDIQIWVDGSNDLDNWAVIGSGPIISQEAVSTVFATIGAPAGAAPIAARFLRLRFNTTIFTVGIATVGVRTSAV